VIDLVGFESSLSVLDELRPMGNDFVSVCPYHHPADFAVLVISREVDGTARYDCQAGCDPLKVALAVAKRLKEGYKPKKGRAIPTNGHASLLQGPSVASVASVASETHVDAAPQQLEEEALYALPGDIVRVIGPHTESHPAALLISFLIGSGCLIGRNPHVYRDGARHACNEFGMLVGLSGVSRKGTASRRVDEVLNSSISSKYTKLITCHGLGSGEALVASLCEDGGEGELADKRRLVFEEEFSRALKVMRREGSTLSENLRTGWDSGVLASRTKGKSLKADGVHVSLLGHITEAELRQELGSVSLFNGFANRFLWICASRVRELPFGGGDAPIAPLVSHLHEALDFSGRAGRIEFSDEVRPLWGEPGNIYSLLTNPPPGLLGAVTSRGDAHVTRLALLYAMLDLEREIRIPHLLAALAVWDYSAKSCAYLFGSSSGDEVADRILEALLEVYPGYLTRKELRDLFDRHARPGSIPKALKLLEGLGKAEQGKVEGAGRYPETWSATCAATCDRSDRSDRSPLMRARELLK
jgi:hypothetical protein